MASPSGHRRRQPSSPARLRCPAPAWTAAPTPPNSFPASAPTCFKSLFALQRKRVRLQDGVAATTQKVVTLLEGRDAAGQSGAIKRITPHLNPRVCRVVALPARMFVPERY
ncbi:MAG: hypothetical protein KIT35_21280 [Piscinibacter sp.]|nr:hypothetical protein [Piscinibacter sp.]